MALFIIALLGALLGAAYVWSNRSKLTPDEMAKFDNNPKALREEVSSRRYRRKFGLVIISIGVILIAVSSFAIVPDGMVGIPITFGNVGTSPLQNGLHFVGPLTTVTDLSVRTETYSWTESSFGNGAKENTVKVRGVTSDNQEVDLELTFLYKLHGEDAATVYREFGVGYPNNILEPAIEAGASEATTQYTGHEISISKRQDLSGAIQAGMNTSIEDILHQKLDPKIKGITIEKVFVRSIGFPEPEAKPKQ